MAEAKKKTLVKLLSCLKDFGKGEKVMRSKWQGFDSYYTITSSRIMNDKNAQIFGVKTWAGKQQSEPIEIKTFWRNDWKFFVPTKEKLAKKPLNEQSVKT